VPWDDLPLPFEPPSLSDALAHLIADHGYSAVMLEMRYLAPTELHPSAPARPGDPETSHLAAKREQDVGRFSSDSRQAKLLYAFSASDLTDQQAAIRIVGLHAAISALEGCRRRCSDLRAVKYIYDTGKRRKNMGSLDDSIVWGLSDAGREALIRLDDTGWSRP